MPRSRHARKIRTAISPRFATRRRGVVPVFIFGSKRLPCHYRRLKPLPCHSEAEGRRISDFPARNQSTLRSRQRGFADSISAIFFWRVQPLICFSREIAARTLGVASKKTRRLILYWRVK